MAKPAKSPKTTKPLTVSKKTNTGPQPVATKRGALGLARTIAPPASYPKFAYGRVPDPSNPPPNVFPMTPGNAAPGLIVWLFLVCCPDFLDAINGAANANSDLITVSEISDVTNLTEDCVNRIFDIYRKSTRTTAYTKVIGDFQAYVSGDGGYDRTNWPNGPIGPTGTVSVRAKDVLLQLASAGAAVVPNAT